MRTTPTLAGALFLAAALLSPGAARAATGFSEQHAVPPAPVVTRHSIRAGQRTLEYASEIGRIAIRDVETGEPRGYMGYIAYRLPAQGAPRPLMFVWNGGPGSNSSILHFEVAGPRRGEGARLVDNPETWLAFADLVFVDPIGTGFSRPAKTEYADEFYGTRGDVASVAEFVRAWRLLHAAEAAPIFLAGESWGAGRAGSVGHRLLRQGLPVRGLVLISGGAGLNAPRLPAGLAAALRIADLAPVALHHGKLARDLGQDAETVRAAAERWARTEYAPALARRDELSAAERQAIVAGLSRHTGLAADRIDPQTLTISPRQYLDGLLADEGRKLNTFDMRLVAEPATSFAAAIDGYLRHELGFLTDLPYVGLWDQPVGYAPGDRYPASVGQRWDYATADIAPEAREAAYRQAVATGGGPPRLGPPLPSTAEAVELDPSLRILVVAGSFDSLASCTANAETERRLDGALRRAMRFRCYRGGHMFYRDPASRARFGRELEDFVTEAAELPRETGVSP